MHLAARAARWSVRHRLLAVGGWLLGVILAIVLGSMIGTRTLADTDYSTGQDARAQRILSEHGYVNPADENVLIQRTTPAANPQALLADPQIRSALTDVAARVRASGAATALRSPLALPGASTDTGLVSHDLRSVLLAFNLKGTEDDPAPVEPTLDAVAAVRAAHPGVSVEQFGNASADKALDATVGNDFHHAELLAIPLTLGILLAVFGAVVAAVIPMGLALTAFVGALGLVAFASRLFPTDDTATSVMLLIGLAVGVDYALFYIRREREERAAGHGPQRALEIAAETSGHAVLVSGLTVAASMAGLFITGLSPCSPGSRSARSSWSWWPCSGRSPCCPRCCRCSATGWSCCACRGTAGRAGPPGVVAARGGGTGPAPSRSNRWIPPSTAPGTSCSRGDAPT